MKILALDPGHSTGYAVIDLTPDAELVDYGTIAITRPGIDGWLQCVWSWLHANFVRGDAIAFEDFIPSSRLRTTREAGEVRAVIRLFASLYASDWAAYMPATVRSQLGVKDKKEARIFAQRVFNLEVKVVDHITDAIAVGLCHAVKTGAWSAHIDLRTNLPVRTSRPSKAIDPERMTHDEMVAAINSGKIRVGRK